MGGLSQQWALVPLSHSPTAPVASTGGGKDNVQHEVIELLLVMGLAKGVAGSKGRSVYVNLVRGLSAGGPLVTRTLIAVMRSLPSAAAEVASESHLETMNGAGLSLSRVQQGNRLRGQIMFDLSILVPFLMAGMFLLSRGGRYVQAGCRGGGLGG